jgi:molybdate transport system regulatory protein
VKSAPNIRFRIDFSENLNLGPGKIALLEAIEAHGSLVGAAASLGMSYRRAWLLLESLNKTFKEPVAHSSAGGNSGGGSSITEFGRLLIKRYRDLENVISDIGKRHLKEILPHVVRNSPTSSSVHRHALSRTIPPSRVKKTRSARP